MSLTDVLLGFVKFVLPVLAAVLGTVLSEKWITAWTWLNAQSPTIKRLIVSAVVYVLYSAGILMGIQFIPAEWANVPPDMLPETVNFGAGVASILVYLFHLADRQKAATKVVEHDPGA